ncbi:MAG: hypothetical protein Fur0040_01440 [Sideroxydans sp.]
MRMMLPETPHLPRYNASPAPAHAVAMNEERLIDIEAKLAFHEDHLEELNKTIYRQQQEIEQLQALCAALTRQMRALAEAGNEKSTANERPPHY